LTELLCAEPQKTLDEFLALDLVAWCLRYRKEVRRGIPYSFAEPWLEEIYTEDAKEKVVMKAAQVRISEYLISEALWRIDTAAWSVFYAFPAFAKMSDFVKTRINPAILACPKMHAQLVNDEIRVKAFQTAALFLSGAQDESQVTTASADLLIRDEYEFFPPEVLPVTAKRLGDSDHAHIRDVSHPRFPGAGIAARHDESDKRRWHVRCPKAKCGHEQPLDWDQVKFSEKAADLADHNKPVPAGEIYLACRRCGTPLDRGAPGRWIPQQPGAGVAGFQVGKLIRPRAGLAEMLRQSRLTVEHEVQAFYNYDLGLPYSPKGMQIGREMLDALVRKDYHLPGGAKFSYMGVDVGLKLHTWIERQEKDGHRYPLFYGALDDFKDLDRLMARFGVRTAVVDAQPETRQANAWALRHPGRAALCYFPSHAEKKPVLLRFDDKKKQVAKGESATAPTATVNRTMICDINENDITEGRLVLPAEAPRHPELYPHFTAMRRVKEKDRAGEIRVTWDDAGKPDHLFFARNYALVARMLYMDHKFGRGISVAADNIGTVPGGREFTKEGSW